LKPNDLGTTWVLYVGHLFSHSDFPSIWKRPCRTSQGVRSSSVKRPSWLSSTSVTERRPWYAATVFVSLAPLSCRQHGGFVTPKVTPKSLDTPTYPSRPNTHTPLSGHARHLSTARHLHLLPPTLRTSWKWTCNSSHKPLLAYFIPFTTP
jgi:hypothetical protein